MTYDLTMWYILTKTEGKIKFAQNKFSVMQNKCLCKTADTYKITLVHFLEAETYVAPISLYLEQLQTKTRYRL